MLRAELLQLLDKQGFPDDVVVENSNIKLKVEGSLKRRKDHGSRRVG